MNKHKNIAKMAKQIRDSIQQFVYKIIDPSVAYIIPTGANEKPIKIALEGATAVREVENADWSREIQVYKKLGVAAVVTNNICAYVNSSLKAE
jgi:hypothetical protein